MIKNIYILIGGFILLVLGIGALNFKELTTQENLKFYLVITASILIILAQRKVLKNIDEKGKS